MRTIVQSKNMKAVTRPAASQTRSPRTRLSFESGLRRRIGALIQERDNLDEEVRQLRAAVAIYSEVVRRLQGDCQRVA